MRWARLVALAFGPWSPTATAVSDPGLLAGVFNELADTGLSVLADQDGWRLQRVSLTAAGMPDTCSTSASCAAHSRLPGTRKRSRRQPPLTSLATAGKSPRRGTPEPGEQIEFPVHRPLQDRRLAALHCAQICSRPGG